MLLIVTIGVIILLTCIVAAGQPSGVSSAARPEERRPARVIVEEGFTSGSIEYGQSVMNHPFLEREAAKLCEKMEADIRNGDRVWYEIDGNEKALSYGKNEASGGVLDYFSNEFPSKEHWGVKGHDQVLGVVWAL